MSFWPSAPCPGAHYPPSHFITTAALCLCDNWVIAQVIASIALQPQGNECMSEEGQGEVCFLEEVVVTIPALIWQCSGDDFWQMTQ